MSRSGYSDDCETDNWSFIKWRGQIASAIRGRRGQAFLKEALTALDAMPEKRLITDELRRGGDVCALGAVGVARGVPLETLDVDDYARLSAVFGIAHQMVREIEWVNDEYLWHVTPEQRWTKMRAWIASQIKDKEP